MAHGERPRSDRAGLAGRPRTGRRAAIGVVAGVAVALGVVAIVVVGRSPGEEDVAVEPAPPEREPDPPAEEPAGTETEPSPSGAEADPPATDAPTPPASEPAPDVVTEDHDGASLAMGPGDTAALRLSSDWLWDEPELSGAAVALATVDHLVDPGYAEWQMEAVATGTAELTVAGHPNCGDETACPPRTVAIRFEVVDG